MDGTRALLLAAICAAVLPGCGRKSAEAEAAAATANTSATAAGTGSAAPFDPMALREMGKGIKPERGPAETYPPRSVAIDFEPGVMDFGVLSPGAMVRGTARLWNIGSEELQVAQSITSCGCTASEDLAGRMIRSGGYIDFATTMTMKSGLGPKKEKITVFFDPDREPHNRRAAILYFTAEVSLPIRLTPPSIPASNRVNDQWVQTREGEVTVTAMDNRPFTILRAHGMPPDFVGFDPAIDAPRAEYTIRWSLDRFEGVIPWFWVIETDRPDCPIIDARIQHSSTLPPRPSGRPWVPKDQRLLVGIVRTGEPFEVSTQIEYGKDYPPDPASAVVMSESTMLKAELIEAQAEAQHLSYRIRLTVTDVAPPGLLYGTVAIGASGFSGPMYVVGRVEE